jgi:sirohydrochlorin ferrochelatase
LEDLALGMSAWPLEPLHSGLATLAEDLDPDLAAKAVDLLARLPQGQRQLRRLAQRPLAAPVQGRLQRRLRRSPLVLVVHGRSGGLIPGELGDWARELEQRRGAPVLLQALTRDAPDPGATFWAGAQRAGAIGLVPLLLLPGGHVRKDVPAIARAWRTRLGPGPAIALQRYPFLGAWPAWQHLLAAQLADRQAYAAIHWLHHPLEGPLAQRYLAHLGTVLGSAGLATPYTAELADLVLPVDRPDPGTVAVLPLTLASNRLTDTLDAGQRLALPPGQARPPQPLPPLLQQPAIRQVLLTALEALP